MQSKQDKEKTKQVYEKPRLRTIELAAEEVLAVGCKTASASGPSNVTCLAAPCIGEGS